jgi:hypothetical protein
MISFKTPQIQNHHSSVQVAVDYSVHGLQYLRRLPPNRKVEGARIARLWMIFKGAPAAYLRNVGIVTDQHF